MTDHSRDNALVRRLATELGFTTAQTLVARLVEVAGKPERVEVVRCMVDELGKVSPKAARAAIEALPELDRRAGLSLVIPWLDVGVSLAGSSGATALKYFQDSPSILGLIAPTDARATVLTIGLEMADQDANVTLEYLKHAPRILSVLPPADIRPWLMIGVELTKIDVVVGLEYIRQIPVVAPVLPISEVRNWIAFGMTLIAPNTLGRPDYIGVMEFLRTSPAILKAIEQPAVRMKVLSLGTLLATHSPKAGAAWLGESPMLLGALPSVEWQVKVLQYGSLLAEQDAEAALSYLRRCPEIIGLIGDLPSAGRFETWWKAGMEVLAYSREAARAYFAMESQKAMSSVEEAMSGIPLKQVARKLQLFIQGLCGTEVTIAALPHSLTTPAMRATVSRDGRTIALPVLLRRYPSAEENERLYVTMVAHEAGHLEFGTYRLTLEPLADLVQAVCRRYGHSKQEPETLGELFRLYPNPRLAQDIWIVLEDARVESLLQTEYPGLRRELAQLAAEAVTPRDPAHGLTVEELIVDCLLRLSTGESEDSAVPKAVQKEVRILWDMCHPILNTRARAEDIVRLAHDLYVRMEELLTPFVEMRQADRDGIKSLEHEEGETGPERTGGVYRPVTNWAYRGAMHPEFIRRDQDAADQSAEQPEEPVARMVGLGDESLARVGTAEGSKPREREAMTGPVQGGRRPLPSDVEEALALDAEQAPMPATTAGGGRTVLYPEWDHTLQDYRLNWCRVFERPAEAGSDECVGSTLTMQRSAVKSLRRYFECLRPPAFRRVTGRTDGEELDIDAVVRRAAEARAGTDGGDRIYVGHDKHERDVAVAFLIDVSGSTSRRLENGRRIIEIEKESLVLLCEALDAVGDQYALYAYSGEGRASVDFLTVKEFGERLGASTAHRLGGLSPHRQNRDGAAIRHATRKLMECEAKTRILILLSDGRPLDLEYKDDYALDDTKTALREAGRRGIVPFCVTVDREADAYVRRMYGDVRYTVIDRVESLPEKLPRMYQKLTA